MSSTNPHDQSQPAALLHVEPCSLTADMRRELAEKADLKRQAAPLLKIIALLTVLCGTAIATFFILAAMIEADGWIPASDAWRTLALSLLAGLALAIIGIWKPAMALRDEAHAAAEHLKRGEAERVRFDLPDRHLLIDNDGQLLCFFSAPGERALYFEINSSPDDPRWRAYETGDLFRRVWTWLRVPGSARRYHFETAGEALSHINLVRPLDDDGYDWEEALGFAPWPKDGDTVVLSAKKLEKIGARIVRDAGSEHSPSPL